MNQFKRAQVVMLPTKKNSSNIAKSINQDILSLYNKNDDKYNQWINQNLYITSDDKIKEGDWVYSINYNNILQLQKPSNKFFYKKIIATTDSNISSPEITSFGRQFTKPSQQFIEKYIESYNAGQVINDVLVEYSYNNPEPNRNILCLKVNSKDNTITIKKLKENWNREEVVILLNKLNNTLNIGSDLTLEQWIEKNL